MLYYGVYFGSVKEPITNRHTKEPAIFFNWNTAYRFATDMNIGCKGYEVREVLIKPCKRKKEKIKP